MRKPDAIDSPADPARWRAFATLLLLSVIWGSSFILIKRGLEVFDGYQLGALRLTISGLAFAPFLLRKIRGIDRRSWPVLALVGLTGTGLPSFLFPLAQEGISSSLAGILNALTPLLTFLFGMVLFRTGFRWSKLVGVLMGLAGAALLIVQAGDASVSGNSGYALLAVAGACCYAIAGNTVGTYLHSMSSLAISAASFGIVAIPAAIYLFGSSGFMEVMRQEPGAWTAFGYVFLLALFSTVLASVIYFQLIQWTDALFASTVSYLSPAIAVAWGLLDGERVTLWILLGMGLILAGLYVNRR